MKGLLLTAALSAAGLGGFGNFGMLLRTRALQT
jgi:hypothetical protein